MKFNNVYSTNIILYLVFFALIISNATVTTTNGTNMEGNKITRQRNPNMITGPTSNVVHTLMTESSENCCVLLFW